MSLLREKLKARVAKGLIRSSVKYPSTWAENYRMMSMPFPGYFGWKHHPWLKEMHDVWVDSDVDVIVGQKSAQAGFTETALNCSFFTLDVSNESLLYILPSKIPDAIDFSSARFDPALEMSPHIEAMFDKNRNVGHKRCGSANMYIRGSNSKSGLKSIPVSRLIIDEFDEMVMENVALAWERMSGQNDKMAYYLSTPTIPEYGINERFEESDKRHFFFPCPSCSKHIQLEYNPEKPEINCFEFNEDNLAASFIFCPKCKTPIDHKAKHGYLQKGIWVPEKPSIKNIVGFRINQLYSSTISPAEFARAIKLSQNDETWRRELYNSKLGLPYVAKGDNIDEDAFNRCRSKEYGVQDSVPYNYGLRTLGVDVGNELHGVVMEWDFDDIGPDLNANAKGRVIATPKTTDFAELDKWMGQYQIHHCIIDMNPERRKAKEFADRWRGFVNLCYYGQGQVGRSINERANDESEIVSDYQVTVNRTVWMETVMGRFHSEPHPRIELPGDICDEYKTHVMNVTKKYERDRHNNIVSRFVTNSERKGDHFFHAQVYAEIALPFAAASSTGSDIHSFL